MGNRTGCVIVILLTVFSNGWPAPVADRYSRSVDWLSRYGYLPPPDPRIGNLQTKEGIQKAIIEMQRFGGLKETGELDQDTLRLISTPRCSLPDIVRQDDMLRKRRKKRYTLSGSRWDKTEITWSIHSYPSLDSYAPSLNQELVPTILEYALKVWSEVTPLNFRRLSGGGGVEEQGDIKVFFSRSFHEDGYPFDGKGGTLAHAFFPGTGDISGDTHFDDEETWSYGDHSGSTDLFTVAIHEFGHALGLSHSSSDLSIMRPYYQGAVGEVQKYILPTDDRLGIQVLYGKTKKSFSPNAGDTPTPNLPEIPFLPRPTQQPDSSLPDRCEGGYDAVANIRGEIFFFKGRYFWRIQRSGSLVSFIPALIENFWMGLPPGTIKIDAVYERMSDSRIIFFIGNQYWVFQDTRSLPGYPRPISEWRMRTKDGKEAQTVEAAFMWANNGKTYLFSSGEFWRFDEGEKEIERTLEGGYPRDAALWKGVPSDPDDIISWGDGDAYFFKGNSYWILKRGGMDKEIIKPKSTAVDWMRCAPRSTPTNLPAKPNPRNEDCSCSLSRASVIHATWWILWYYLIALCFMNVF